MGNREETRGPSSILQSEVRLRKICDARSQNWVGRYLWCVRMDHLIVWELSARCFDIFSVQNVGERNKRVAPQQAGVGVRDASHHGTNPFTRVA